MKKFLVLFVLVPLGAVADHEPAFQSLIDEPANMLDVAMLRMQNFIIWTKPHMAAEYHSAAETDKQLYIDINSYYRAEDALIYVSASLMDLQSTREQMEAGCRRVLNMMTINISKGLAGLFSHVDGSFRPSANGQPANLFEMIELRCFVHAQSTADRRFHGAMPLDLDAKMTILDVDR